jgi:hypothetical protein
VQIEKTRLEQLEDAEFKLNCLERGGVDNWEWYGESLNEYREMKERKEKINETLDELLSILSGGIEEPAGRGCGYGVREETQEELKDFLLKVMAGKKND